MGAESRDRLEIIQTIVNSIGDAVVACDLQGKFFLYNPAAEQLLGPDVSGDNPDLWTANFGSFLTDKVTRFPTDELPLLLALKGKETNDVEQFIRNKNRPKGVYIEVSGRPIIDSENNIVGGVIIVRDITRRKEVEAEIIAANIELAAVNKELESFSYAVSHDLRTPLRSIIGFSDMLIKKYSNELSPEALDLQNRVKDSGEKLGQLIDGLLDLSRLSRGDIRREQVNLSEIANGVVSDLKVQTPTRSVRFEIADGVTGYGDQRLLRSVLQNLIGNAWKFTAKKSDARIAFGIAPSKNDKITYFVRDNGAGFNEKYSNKLFSIFQRLHSVQDFEGNGIGLATVQRIINRHGGTIWAEGKPNEGATFYFTL